MPLAAAGARLDRSKRRSVRTPMPAPASIADIDALPPPPHTGLLAGGHYQVAYPVQRAPAALRVRAVDARLSPRVYVLLAGRDALAFPALPGARRQKRSPRSWRTWRRWARTSSTSMTTTSCASRDPRGATLRGDLAPRPASHLAAPTRGSTTSTASATAPAATPAASTLCAGRLRERLRSASLDALRKGITVEQTRAAPPPPSRRAGIWDGGARHPRLALARLTPARPAHRCSDEIRPELVQMPSLRLLPDGARRGGDPMAPHGQSSPATARHPPLAFDAILPRTTSPALRLRLRADAGDGSRPRRARCRARASGSRLSDEPAIGAPRTFETR